MRSLCFQELVHFPHEVGRGRASMYLYRVNVNITGPMLVVSVGGWEYIYVVGDNCTCAVCTPPKSKIIDAFKTFKAATENESGKNMQELMTDNVWELSTGKVCHFARRKGSSLTLPYHLALNGMAKKTIGALTNAVRSMLHGSGLPKSCGKRFNNTATYIRNRTLTSSLEGHTPY